MTDHPQRPSGAAGDALHTSGAARRRLARRYRAETIFRLTGMGAVAVAVGFLAVLLFTVVTSGLPAFTYHYLTLPVSLPVDATDEESIARIDFNGVVKDALAEALPFVDGRSDRRLRNGLVSVGAPIVLRNEVLDDPQMVGSTEPVGLLLSDFADLYLKGTITPRTEIATDGTATPEAADGTVRIRSTADDFSELLQAVRTEFGDLARERRREAEARTRTLKSLEARIATLDERIAAAEGDERQRLATRKEDLAKDLTTVRGQVEGLLGEAAMLEERAKGTEPRETMTSSLPSYLVHINGGVVKVNTVEADAIEGDAFVPLASTQAVAAGSWSIERLDAPESLRKLSDKEIAWIDYLARKGHVEERFNSVFFTSGASREPEMAGIWGAVVGSFFTMLVTLLLSFPIGVAAAIYLEEFAPKNRLTHFIEVNINNLAAVPSIVFGLLGLAMFLNVFGFPRSAPLVGGMVLALMTLPTIIIASRAALKAVPPSIREAALGVGASRIQAVFHHVLPLAMPGILTGTIIGMAQALGETAPLLMIGMVAFIVDIPGGIFEPSTVLPVQIYMWSDFPEPAFQQKTSAAIMVLLGFLVLMNAIAIVLRKRFERRW